MTINRTDTARLRDWIDNGHSQAIIPKDIRFIIETELEKGDRIRFTHETRRSRNAKTEING